uniref:Putative nuclease HARBI1 n=1 Tax=Magallana gigas TaxID=29159 RepID=A0A8W8IF33_MAGGI
MADLLLFGNVFVEKKKRNYRERIEMTGLSDTKIRSRFRFRRDSITYISDIVRYDLQRATKRSLSISVEMQVMLALRFYASGSFLEVIGDTMGFDKSTVSWAIDDVTNALIAKKDRFIKWPNHVEILKSKQNFFSRGKFINIDAQWPGSTHDSHVFRTSVVCTFFEHRGVEDGYLIGDSGYACSMFLITPYLHPANLSEEAFNTAHCRTRNAVERVFGWWKRRFHVLHSEIKMKPAKVCKIIGACAILHNIAISLKEEMDDEDEDDVNAAVHLAYRGPEDGRAIRNFITRTYF